MAVCPCQEEHLALRRHFRCGRPWLVSGRPALIIRIGFWGPLYYTIITLMNLPRIAFVFLFLLAKRSL